MQIIYISFHSSGQYQNNCYFRLDDFLAGYVGEVGGVEPAHFPLETKGKNGFTFLYLFFH